MKFSDWIKWLSHQNVTIEKDKWIFIGKSIYFLFCRIWIIFYLKWIDTVRFLLIIFFLGRCESIYILFYRINLIFQKKVSPLERHRLRCQNKESLLMFSGYRYDMFFNIKRETLYSVILLYYLSSYLYYGKITEIAFQKSIYQCEINH